VARGLSRCRAAESSSIAHANARRRVQAVGLTRAAAAKHQASGVLFLAHRGALQGVYQPFKPPWRMGSNPLDLVWRVRINSKYYKI
jgi:hypothetical protein